MREDLLAELQARLNQFATERDPDAVLSEDALALVNQLMNGVADPAAELEVMHAAGLLHWYRYLALDRGEDQPDLAATLGFLAPVYRAQPDAVPDEVRQYFDDHPPPDLDSPEAMGSRAMQLLYQAQRTDDPVALNAGIDLLQTLAATPAGNRDQAAVLSNLCAALGIRFDRTGDLADLDLAAVAGQRAVAATPTDNPDREARLTNLGGALQRRFVRIRKAS